MKTNGTQKVAKVKLAASVMMGLAVIFLTTGTLAYAKEGKGHVNPPGPVGGKGSGPAFRDKDNNPPGPRGGQGSNWEKNDYKRRDNDSNPPGPRGGQGSNWEKNDYKRKDNDSNPPGPRGGQGSNWEKNDYKRRDNDSNPPGATGGPGTNWENKPGRQGGQGASPDYQRQGPGQALSNLKDHRAKMAEKGASTEELAKMDGKIQAMQTRFDEYQSKKTAETAAATGQ